MCITNEHDSVRLFADRGADLLASSTSSVESLLVCGDSAFQLLECNDAKLLPEMSNIFMKKGGLAVLTVALTLSDYGSTASGYAIRKITDSQWETLLRDDILVIRVLDILLYAFDRTDWRRELGGQVDDHNISASISQLLSQILRVKGLNFFYEGCRQTWFSPRFNYLSKHFSREPERYWVAANVVVVYNKYPWLRFGVRRRYCGSLLDANIYKLEDIASVGCVYESCQIKKRLLKLANRCKDENLGWNALLDEEKTLITRWGCDVKFCSRCYYTVYCSRECQKADWADSHRSECRGPEALKAVLPRLTSALKKAKGRNSDIGGEPKSPTGNNHIVF